MTIQGEAYEKKGRRWEMAYSLYLRERAVGSDEKCLPEIVERK